MKFFVLVFIALATLTYAANASIVLTKLPKEKKLIATKGTHKKKYKIGAGLRLHYWKNDSLVLLKGFLFNVTNDSITIRNFLKKKLFTTTVAVNKIDAITKINKKNKKQFYFAAAALFLLSLPLLYVEIFKGGAMGLLGLLLYIPPVFALYFLPLAFLIIWGIQWLSKKSKKKGWNFSTEE